MKRNEKTVGFVLRFAMTRSISKLTDNSKAIKRIEMTSDSTTILLHFETETGKEEVYRRPSGSPNYSKLRKLLSSKTCSPNDIVCGNENFII